MIEGRRHSVWMRRGMFLTVNLAAAAVAFGLIIFPVLDFFAGREAEIAERRMALARLDAIAAHEGTVQSLVKNSAAVKERFEFLRGPNEGVVNADLQNRLKTMVQATGARLRSVRSISPPAADDIKFIGAQIELTGPLRAVHQTVYALESAYPYLFVVGAVIKPTSQMPAQSVNGGAAAEPTIDAQLDVIAAVELEEKTR